MLRNSSVSLYSVKNSSSSRQNSQSSFSRNKENSNSSFNNGKQPMKPFSFCHQVKPSFASNNFQNFNHAERVPIQKPAVPSFQQKTNFQRPENNRSFQFSRPQESLRGNPPVSLYRERRQQGVINRPQKNLPLQAPNQQFKPKIPEIKIQNDRMRVDRFANARAARKDITKQAPTRMNEAPKHCPYLPQTSNLPEYQNTQTEAQTNSNSNNNPEIRNLVQSFTLASDISDSQSMNYSALKGVEENNTDNLEELIEKINYVNPSEGDQQPSDEAPRNEEPKESLMDITVQSEFVVNEIEDATPNKSELGQADELRLEDLKPLVEGLYANYKEGKSDWKKQFERIILTKEGNITHFCVTEGRFKPTDELGQQLNRDSRFCILLLQYIRERALDSQEFSFYKDVLSQAISIETLQRELESFLDQQQANKSDDKQDGTNQVSEYNEESLSEFKDAARELKNAAPEEKEQKVQLENSLKVAAVPSQSRPALTLNKPMQNARIDIQNERLKRRRSQLEAQGFMEEENAESRNMHQTKKFNQNYPARDIKGNQRVQLSNIVRLPNPIKKPEEGHRVAPNPSNVMKSTYREKPEIKKIPSPPKRDLKTIRALQERRIKEDQQLAQKRNNWNQGNDDDCSSAIANFNFGLIELDKLKMMNKTQRVEAPKRQFRRF